MQKVQTATYSGIEGCLIEVECDTSNGLPGMIIVGLAAKAVDEAKERLRAAFRNSSLSLPPRRIILNLAPADRPKDGTGFDLALAVGILANTGQVSAVPAALFLGELSLDGNVKPVPGALIVASLAKELGLKAIFVAEASAAEASLVPELDIYPVRDLKELYRHLIDEAPILPFKAVRKQNNIVRNTTLFDDIFGQYQAKRALEIAAAGRHNLLMSGPPGTGKSLLAKSLTGLLPDLEYAEYLEVMKIYSAAGIAAQVTDFRPPLRQPHHTSSQISLIGGGANPRPGEITLSHNGILFLDELPEFNRQLLDSLRQPLEDGKVQISRIKETIHLPAQFILVATQNPCPCGYTGDPTIDCKCSEVDIRRYQRRVSGPVLDRIDLSVRVERVAYEDTRQKSTNSAVMDAAIARVTLARERQKSRNQTSANAYLNRKETEKYCALPDAGHILLAQAVNHFGLSTRAQQRVVKVSRTIADLEGSNDIATEHLTEALQYRVRS